MQAAPAPAHLSQPPVPADQYSVCTNTYKSATQHVARPSPHLAVEPNQLAQRLLLLPVAARRLAAVLQLVPA